MAEEVQVNKERNPKIVIARPTRKTVLLCLNGFQTQDTHDCTPMYEYFQKQFAEEYDNCEVYCVRLFAPADRKTHRAKYFEKQARNAIEEYKEKGYDIILMGYSFSCALAAKLAVKYKKDINRVIFVAPVYDTIINNMIPGYIKYAVKYSKLQKKYGAKVANAIGRQTIKGLVGLLLAIFRSILTNRKYFTFVKQDTLLIRGDEDVLCTKHSLKQVARRLDGNYEVYHYPKMTHSILKTLKYNGVVYEDILNFSFGTPFILEKKAATTLQKAKNERVAVDADGEPVPTFDEIFSELDPDMEESSQAQNDF